ANVAEAQLRHFDGHSELGLELPAQILHDRGPGVVGPDKELTRRRRQRGAAESQRQNQHQRETESPLHDSPSLWQIGSANLCIAVVSLRLAAGVAATTRRAGIASFHTACRR